MIFWVAMPLKTVVATVTGIDVAIGADVVFMATTCLL